MQCKLLWFIWVLLLTFNGRSYCQEAINHGVPIKPVQADSLFLARNLLLLAEKYNVEAARAQIIQARLFNNITFSVSQNVYNPETKDWFDLSEAGETAASFQKLFLLAGKRNKRIRMADLSYQKEEQHYFDMIRTLKFTMRTDFYNIYFLKQILAVYDKEITSLSHMVAVFEQQSAQGYVSRSEALRLKSSLLSLESEKNSYVTQLIANLADFNLLLQSTNIDYSPQPDSLFLNSTPLQCVKLQALIDTAVRNRYDLLMAGSDLNINEMNVKYQKSQAVPDLTMMAGWDRNGSFVHNYNFIGMQIDLPFSNRNQGNIKSAEFNLASSKAALQSAGDKVKSDVIGAYATALAADNLYHRFDAKFVKELAVLTEEMKINYEKRNVSTVEFLDFYDAFKNNIIQLNNLQNARASAFENLSFSVGKDFMNK